MSESLNDAVNEGVSAAGAMAEQTLNIPEPPPGEIDAFFYPRTKAWQNLFENKGWLKDGKIVLPPNILVYIYFPPATTDINTIESISLQRVTEVTEHFIIHRVNAHEEEYYLWEDVQCLRIKTKKPSRFG